MSKGHLIDLAYETAHKKFKTKPFTFRELFKATSNSTDKAEMADLYVDLISDIRFIYIGKEKWALTENFKNDDFQKISSSMFGLDKYTIEDLDDYDNELSSDELINEDDEIIDDEYDSEDLIIESIDEDIDDIDESDNIIDDIEDLDDDIEDLEE